VEIRCTWRICLNHQYVVLRVTVLDWTLEAQCHDMEENLQVDREHQSLGPALLLVEYSIKVLPEIVTRTWSFLYSCS